MIFPVRMHLNYGGFGSEIEVDGHMLSRVQSIHVDAAAGQPPRVTVGLVLKEGAVVDGEMQVVVDEKTAATLTALGWTPPSTEAGAV